MPNGFWYAGGDVTREAAIPASAFSKGDLLVLDSNSSLSRIPTSATTGISNAIDIVGVADADSTDSINNVVSYTAPQPDTLYWASLATNASTITPGTECDIFYDVANNNRYYVDPGSADTARAVIVRGPGGVGGVDQSVQSKALVKLIYHAGNIDLS